MKEFIKLQYTLYKVNKSSISLETIQLLAKQYLTTDEYKKLFEIE